MFPVKLNTANGPLDRCRTALSTELPLELSNYYIHRFFKKEFFFWKIMNIFEIEVIDKSLEDGFSLRKKISWCCSIALFFNFFNRKISSNLAGFFGVFFSINVQPYNI